MPMKKIKFVLVNAITCYRIVITPVLIWLAIDGNYDAFRWLLPVSFLTDLIDGFLARRLRATSVLGSKLDSIGDDLTFVAAAVGMFAFRFEFVQQHFALISIMFGLYLMQTACALIKYKKMTSFHTYLAKLAMIVQGSFLILLFLLPEPVLWLFYAAAIVTILDLAEEIIIIFYLKDWQANVKGLFWVMRNERNRLMNHRRAIAKFGLRRQRQRGAYGA
jgi:phosphatidylglycerophosphate synthase